MAADPDFPNKLIEKPRIRDANNRPYYRKPSLDRMAMVGLVWYEHQMWRMAAGKNTDPRLSALGVVVKNDLKRRLARLQETQSLAFLAYLFRRIEALTLQ